MKRKQKVFTGLVVVIFLTITNAGAQAIPDSIIKKIDSLFVKWNTTNEVNSGRIMHLKFNKIE